MFRKENESKDDIGLLKTMVAGSIGGMVFWTIVYPVDLAKSRIQIHNTNELLLPLIVKIARTEGIRALFSGLSPTLLKTLPSAATLFAVYEYSKRFMYYITEDW